MRRCMRCERRLWRGIVPRHDRPVESDLALARRHVAEGEERVKRQRDILGRLDTLKLPTSLAKALLDEMVRTLDLMIEHRDQLESEAEK
jgi:hypothetical protein